MNKLLRPKFLSDIITRRCHIFNGSLAIVLLALTHFPLEKMAAFSETTFKCIFMHEMFCISIEISLKFILKGPIDNKTALVWIMAWRWIGAEPTLTGIYSLECDWWKIILSVGNDLAPNRR